MLYFLVIPVQREKPPRWNLWAGNDLESGMKKLFLLAGFVLGLSASPVLAALTVDVTQANPQPLPIAIPDFVPGAPADAQAGANIAGVVRADLERSGLFKPIDPKAFVDHVTNINAVPAFANWRVINAQGLVTGQVVQQPEFERAQFHEASVHADAVS